MRGEISEWVRRLAKCVAGLHVGAAGAADGEAHRVFDEAALATRHSAQKGGKDGRAGGIARGPAFRAQRLRCRRSKVEPPVEASQPASGFPRLPEFVETFR